MIEIPYAFMSLILQTSVFWTHPYWTGGWNVDTTRYDI